MTFSMVLETFASLTLQVTLLIGVAAWMVRKQHMSGASDWCWAVLHICILALTSAAAFVPHLRLIIWADFQPSTIHPIADAVCSVAGRICGWTWLSGALATIALCIGGICRETACVRRAVTDEQSEHLLHQAVPALTTANRPIEIRFSQDSVSPFCWQFHHPVIVLPDIVRDFPVTEQAAIVRHELAHLILQHPLHLFLQRLVEAIYWFHPLVWWASRQSAAAREFRCDREAVNSRPEVADYLRCLLRLIESQVSAPGHLPAVLGFIGDAPLMARRADLLVESLNHSKKPIGAWRSAIVLILAGILCSLSWLPLNPSASRRADWSPWPSWSAHALDAVGVAVRDFEVDAHRLKPHEHLR